jgi:BASS family bile acid:Na+ symporter
MMPIAMAIGILFYPFLARLSALTPVLIFLMLFLTYNNIDLREMRISWLHFWLLVVQIAGCLVGYWLLRHVNQTVAQTTLICLLAPTATAAPVIAAMLGGNIACLAAYSLLSNLAVACLAPFIFSLVGVHQDISFMESFLLILRQVSVMLLSPFAAALVIRAISSKAQKFIAKQSYISFYLWVIALIVVTARTVGFIMAQDSREHHTELLVALTAGVICVGQFFAGRRIGRRYGNTVAGGQGLGQKNTILAIWMAQTYLDPISSVGPGAYVLWQNIVNSWQLWRQKNRLTDN